MENLINDIALFKEFILMSIVATLLLFIIFSIGAKRYTYQKNKRDFIGVFFMIDNKSMVLIASYFLYFLFLLSCIVRLQPLAHVHLLFFIVLTLFIVVLNLRSKMSLSVMLHHAIQFGFLFVLNALLNYVQNIRFDQSYFVLFIVGSIVLITYAITIFLYEIKNVSIHRRVMNEKETA